MLALIEHTPDIYLDEMQEQLYVQHDVDVSLATLCRTLHRLGIGSKKVCYSCPFSDSARPQLPL
jgi:transposase